MKDYELVLIINPQSQDEKRLVEKIKKVISSLEGEVKKITFWGKSELAYPIKGAKQGNYYLLNISLPNSGPNQFKRKIRLEEEIFRYLLIKQKEKLAKDISKAMAK